MRRVGLAVTIAVVSIMSFEIGIAVERNQAESIAPPINMAIAPKWSPAPPPTAGEETVVEPAPEFRHALDKGPAALSIASPAPSKALALEVRDTLGVSILEISGDERFLTVRGIDGTTLAVLDLITGKATLRAKPRYAARQYWRAVEILAPKCRNDTP